ncbi:hypothetical protein ACFLXE_02660 [Chloroflexota bacterium]
MQDNSSGQKVGGEQVCRAGMARVVADRIWGRCCTQRNLATSNSDIAIDKHFLVAICDENETIFWLL